MTPSRLLQVAFLPRDRMAVDDAVVFRTGGGESFRVDLVAKPQRSPIKIETEEISFGLTAVGDTGQKTLRVRNLVSEEVEVEWNLSAPFTATPARTTLGPSEHFDFNLSFEPKKAASYTQRALLRCDGGNVDVQVRGVSKYPYLRIEGARAGGETPVDFGSDVVGSTQTKSIRLTNDGEVATSFRIEPVRALGTNPFEPSLTRTLLAPKASADLQVFFRRDVVGSVGQEFEIYTGDQKQCSLHVAGVTDAPLVQLSCTGLEFSPVACGKAAVYTVSLHNRSRREVHFQWKKDTCAFNLKPHSGVLKPHNMKTITVSFEPKHEGFHVHRCILCCEEANPLCLHLEGRCMGKDSSGRGKGTTPVCHRLVTRSLVLSKLWGTVFRTEVIDPPLSVNPGCLDFGSSSVQKERHYKQLEMTNRSSEKLFVFLDIEDPERHKPDSDPSSFQAFPDSAGLEPGETKSFQISFKPAAEGHFFNYTCFVRTVKDAHYVLPEVPLSVQLLGDSFLYQEEKQHPSVRFSSTKISFATATPKQEVYKTIALSNAENEAVSFGIRCPEEDSRFQVEPQRGVIPAKGSQLVSFKFSAAEKGNYASQLKCVLNHNAAEATSLYLNAAVDTPRIQICTPSQWMQRKDTCSNQSDQPISLSFKETVIGKSTERELIVVNRSGVPVHYDWVIPEDMDSIFAVAETKGLLAPWDQKKHTFSFTPNVESSFSTQVQCVVCDEAGNRFYEELLLLSGNGSSLALQIQAIESDLGVVKVFHPTAFNINLFNPSLDYLDCQLSFAINGQKAAIKDFDILDKSKPDFGSAEGQTVMVQKVAGDIPPRRRKILRGIFWAKESKEYVIEASIISQHEDDSRSAVFHCRAESPELFISDVFSLGKSKSRVQESMQLLALNKLLQDPLNEIDLELTRVTAEEGDMDPQWLQSIPAVECSFGLSSLGADPVTFYLQLFNPTQISVEWKWHSPYCHDSIVEACDEPLPPEDPAEQMREFVLNNRIFSFEPQRGEIEAGMCQTIHLTYTPLAEGVHRLPLVFEVVEGKKVAVHLSGSSRKESIGPMVLSKQKLDAVPVGCRQPPSQSLLLHNTGTCSVHYSLDLSQMEQLNKENYDFPIFSFRGNPQGSVERSASVPVALTFQPLEEKEYKLELPLQIDGKQAEALIIQAQGCNLRSADREHHTQIEPEVAQESGGFAADLPALVKFSSQSIHFSDMCTESQSRRFLEIKNQVDFEVAYAFDLGPNDTALLGRLTIHPPSGTLHSGQSKAILFQYNASSHPESFEAEVALHLTTPQVEKVESVTTASCSEEIIAIHPDPSQTIPPKERTVHGDFPRHLSSTFASRTKSDALNRMYQQMLLKQQQSVIDHPLQNNDRSQTQMLIIEIHGRVGCPENRDHETKMHKGDAMETIDSWISDFLNESPIQTALSRQLYPHHHESTPDRASLPRMSFAQRQLVAALDDAIVGILSDIVP